MYRNKIKKVRIEIYRYLQNKNKKEGKLFVEDNLNSFIFDKNTLIRVDKKVGTRIKGSIDDCSTEMLAQVADMIFTETRGRKH